MNRHERRLQTILGEGLGANIRFADLRSLMQHLGIEERILGSHHLYRKDGITEKANLQRDDGNS